jgi:hypothetical protein
MEQKYVSLVNNPYEARSFGMLMILAQKHINSSLILFKDFV